MKALNLGKNNISNEGIMNLGEVIAECESLKKLNICDNKIDNEGFKILLKSILENFEKRKQTFEFYLNSGMFKLHSKFLI